MYRIATAGLDGSGRRVIVTSSDDLSPTWAPAGSKILYACGGICTIRPDGTDQLQITSTRAENPRYSPDGSHIVFTCVSPTPLCVIDADGQHLVRFGESRFYTIARWSPDGTAVTYRCALDARGTYSAHFHRTQGTRPTVQTDICSSRIDGSAPLNVSSSAASEDTPTYSPGS